MTDSLTRMGSWPFDSMFDGYDDDGWPVYDRAVGASLLRMCFRQFFSDGVFEREGNAFWIEPAETGLAITLKPGAAIIRGGIGGIETDTTIQLDAASPIGKTPYAVFARVDDDKDFRSLYIHVVSGTGSADPVPPEPEVSANAKEIRLGYVILPSNATDMSGAVIVNEQGLEACPFAAPFREIDVSYVMNKLYEETKQLLTDMQVEFDNVRDIINTAFYNWYQHLQDELDANQAANLQMQIDALKYWYVQDTTLYVPQTAASVADGTLIIAPDMTTTTSEVA